MTITHEQAKELGDKFYSAFAAGFSSNSHAKTMRGLLASKVDMDWSDGLKGTKTPTEIFDQFSTTWGMMVSDIMFDHTVITDTTNERVSLFGMNTHNIDGKMDKAHLVQNRLCFVLGFDDDGKCSSWRAYWENAHPQMLNAIGHVTEAMKAREFVK
ncbi:hypothetical protein ACHAXN_011229 [Cyclotella atomus]